MAKGHLGSILSFPVSDPAASHGISHYDFWANVFFAGDHGKIESLGSWDKRSHDYVGQLFDFLYSTWGPVAQRNFWFLAGNGFKPFPTLKRENEWMFFIASSMAFL